MDFPTLESLAKRYVEEDVATMEFNTTPATRKVTYNSESEFSKGPLLPYALRSAFVMFRLQM